MDSCFVLAPAGRVPFSRFPVKGVDIFGHFLAVRASLAQYSTGCCYVDVMHQQILAAITCLQTDGANVHSKPAPVSAQMEVGTVYKPYLRMLNLENNHDTFQHIVPLRLRGLKDQAGLRVLSLASISDIRPG